MSIKCHDCQDESSYGRSIVHSCKKRQVFFGSIFHNKDPNREWNCLTATRVDRDLHNTIEFNPRDLQLGINNNLVYE